MVDRRAGGVGGSGGQRAGGEGGGRGQTAGEEGGEGLRGGE